MGYSITAQNASGCISMATTGTMGAQPMTPNAPMVSLTQPTCTNANGMVAITSNTTGLTFSTNGINYNAYTVPYTVAANMGYSITAQNASGCISMATTGTIGTQPMIPDAPMVSLTQPTCTNANGMVAITSNTTGLTFSTNGINYNAYTAPYTVAANMGYSITAQNASGCISMATTGTMGAQPMTPAAPTGAASQSFCSGTSPTIAGLVVTGSNIIWYNAMTSGTVLSVTTPLVNGTTYYASQNNGTCESSRLAVTAIITNSNTQTVSITAGATAVTSGTSVIFTATTTGTVAATDIKWYINSVYTGSTGTTYSYIPVQGDLIKAGIDQG